MRHYKILLYLIALSSMAGCIRRPFGEIRTEVKLSMEVNMEIKQEISGVEIPELMKVCLCNRETGALEYIDYLPPDGGFIYPKPGTYDILVFNINTESTVIRNGNNLYTIEATTNEISEYVRSQLRPFLSARDKARQEAAQKAGNLKDTPPDTKDDTKVPDELIVNEPDHLFVGRKDDIVIPQMEIGETMNLLIELNAETIVEAWNVELVNIEGGQYISSVSALMSGMVESTRLSDKKDSDKPVTVYFEMGVSEDKKSIVATFRSFGKNPLFANELEIDLAIKDTGGNDHYYHFDVTEQFDENNEGHKIIVQEPVKVEKPPEGGGGFQPEVDDWEDVNTDIII